MAYVVGDGTAAGVVDPRLSEIDSYRTLARRMDAQIQWALFTSHSAGATSIAHLPVVQPIPSSPRAVRVGRRTVELRLPDAGPPRRQAFTLGASHDGAAFVTIVDRIVLPLGRTVVEVWAHQDEGRIVAVVGEKILVGRAATPPHLAVLPDPWLVFAGSGPLGSVTSVGAVRRNSTPKLPAD